MSRPSEHGIYFRVLGGFLQTLRESSALLRDWNTTQEGKEVSLGLKVLVLIMKN